MRGNLKKALLWMLAVPLLGAWVSPPPTPASGDIGDSFRYRGTVAVGGAVSSGCGSTPGYTAYTLQAQAGSQLKLEVTHLGSSMHLDTGLFVYGPKDAQGRFGSTVLAQDDDSGYGKLSRIDLATLSKGGEYLVVVGWENAAGMQFRLQVDCVGGTCLPQPEPAPSSYTLALTEHRLTPQLESSLASANALYEGTWSYLRRFDFHWPYSTEASLARAAEAVLAMGLYRGYRSDSAPVVLTYEQFQTSMYSHYRPLHPDILATYGSPFENVQVMRYFRSFSTGPNGDHWRTLHVLFFPRSYKVLVYEQTAHEI
jgi:hypothetical protein